MIGVNTCVQYYCQWGLFHLNLGTNALQIDLSSHTEDIIGLNMGASALEIDSSSHTDYIGSHLGASALQIDPSSHTDDIGSNLGASALQTDSSSHTMTTLDQNRVPVHYKLIHPPTQW